MNLKLHKNVGYVYKEFNHLKKQAEALASKFKYCIKMNVVLTFILNMIVLLYGQEYPYTLFYVSFIKSNKNRS